MHRLNGTVTHQVKVQESSPREQAPMTKTGFSPPEVGVDMVFIHGGVSPSMATIFFGMNAHTLDLAGNAAKVAVGALRHKHRRMRRHVSNEGRHNDDNGAFFSLQAVSITVRIKLSSN